MQRRHVARIRVQDLAKAALGITHVARALVLHALGQALLQPPTPGLRHAALMRHESGWKRTPLSHLA